MKLQYTGYHNFVSTEGFASEFRKLRRECSKYIKNNQKKAPVVKITLKDKDLSQDPHQSSHLKQNFCSL